jgi:thioredoxin reductase (NADPH)
MTYDLLIIGAGPGGIGMAIEAIAAGIRPESVLMIEKAAEHSFMLKKYYPESKLVTANYKGFEAVCTGVMCLRDSSKNETISYLDRAITENHIVVRYNESVYAIHKHDGEQRFTVLTDKGTYDTKVIVVAIGILGKPNKPGYRLPHSLKDRLLFDITSREVAGADVLVVGGGDSASEYCQYLVQQGNRVALSYRKGSFTRMNPINLESILGLAADGRVEVLFGSTITGIQDRGGKPEVSFDGLPAKIFDYVLYALGGTSPRNFLKTIGIEFDGEDPYLKDGYETNVPGMFLIGDLSAGTQGGSIIWAFNSANAAMKRIGKEYLASDP